MELKYVLLIVLLIFIYFLDKKMNHAHEINRIEKLKRIRRSKLRTWLYFLLKYPLLIVDCLHAVTLVHRVALPLRREFLQGKNFLAQKVPPQIRSQTLFVAGLKMSETGVVLVQVNARVILYKMSEKATFLG